MPCAQGQDDLAKLGLDFEVSCGIMKVGSFEDPKMLPGNDRFQSSRLQTMIQQADQAMSPGCQEDLIPINVVQ